MSGAVERRDVKRGVVCDDAHIRSERGRSEREELTHLRLHQQGGAWLKKVLGSGGGSALRQRKLVYEAREFVGDNNSSSFLAENGMSRRLSATKCKK
jgi:hypothetical protein